MLVSGEEPLYDALDLIELQEVIASLSRLRGHQRTMAVIRGALADETPERTCRRLKISLRTHQRHYAKGVNLLREKFGSDD
jgi:hypothetical protein